MASVFLEGEAVEVGNIFCIGRNYAAHVEELKNEIPSEPVVFMKPSGSILNSGGTILLPEFSRDVQFECELVLLIGRDSDGTGEGEDILGCVGGVRRGFGFDRAGHPMPSEGAGAALAEGKRVQAFCVRVGFCGGRQNRQSR